MVGTARPRRVSWPRWLLLGLALPWPAPEVATSGASAAHPGSQSALHSLAESGAATEPQGRQQKPRSKAKAKKPKAPPKAKPKAKPAAKPGAKAPAAPAVPRTPKPLPIFDGPVPPLIPERDALSLAAAPAGADRAPEAVTWVRQPASAHAEIDGEGLAFRWQVELRQGHPLRSLFVEEGGLRLELLENAYLSPDTGELTLDQVQVEGDQIAAAYSDGTQVTWRPVGRSLEIELSGPPLRAVSLGGLPAAAPGSVRLGTLQVPYADHTAVGVVRLRDGGVRYVSAYFDPSVTQSTVLQTRSPGARGEQQELYYSQFADYLPGTDGEARPLRERLWITWSDRLLDVLPVHRRPAAPFRAASADYYYLDYNHTPFADAARDLRLAQASGLRDLHVWMRHWQRDGYDTGYPTQVLPPREEWGGHEGLLEVRAAAGEAGWPFALHHNWVFNTELLPEGSMLAYDGEPLSQSAESSAGQYLRSGLARDLAPEIEGLFHELYRTRGSYSDSITAVYPPVDMDARLEGWGLLQSTVADWSAVLDTLREVHGPPLCGEGSLGFGNLLWPGRVDVLTGEPGLTAEQVSIETLGRYVPVVPHYLLERLHPIVTHAGVSFPPRFLYPDQDYGDGSYAPSDRDQMIALGDLYAAAGYTWWYPRTEVGDLVRDWWATAATRRFLGAPERRVEAIHYEDGFGRWVELEGILAQGRPLTIGHVRLRVRWTDGTLVYGNLTPQPWAVSGAQGQSAVLAPYGRWVLAPELDSGHLIEGSAFEFARTADSLWLDGRGRAVQRFGLATDGAVAVRFGPLGLEVFPCPDYVFGWGPAAEVRTRVPTSYVELAPEVLGRSLAAGPLEIRFRGYDPERRKVAELAVEPLEWDGRSPLRFERARWEALGASAFELRPRAP
jgi:hypothetical protein